ncbi:hypothetical protein [Clostridioides difficile]|uniref:hypothetical protein n=1 Tax=Clostridioides difficile TaxID=1496 RepID=UPI001C1CED95|nr:hypothetical protein [Clostridioides difficile]HBF6291366.1 hypothetical protein [Clostridioides difficile]HBG4071404.1 hypothetical protein [Clostridioides difficile]HBY2690094.1 hypothetical protein [Clostridioides difficile]HDO9121446.1 hypothetical protein [Clostridioides difficile]
MKTKIKTNLNHTHLPEEVAATLDRYITVLNALGIEFNNALASGDYDTAEYCKENAETVRHYYETTRAEHDVLYAKKLRYRGAIWTALERDAITEAVTLVKLLGVSQKELCERAKIDYSNLSSEISGNRRMGVKTRNKLYKAIWEVLA